MNASSLATRLLSLAAAAAIVLTVFDSVVLMTSTLPEVRVARAQQAERLAAARPTVVAVAAGIAKTLR